MTALHCDEKVEKREKEIEEGLKEYTELWSEESHRRIKEIWNSQKKIWERGERISVIHVISWDNRLKKVKWSGIQDYISHGTVVLKKEKGGMEEINVLLVVKEKSGLGYSDLIKKIKKGLKKKGVEIEYGSSHIPVSIGEEDYRDVLNWYRGIVSPMSQWDSGEEYWEYREKK